MAQRLRVLDAPPEDTGLIHNIHMTAYNCLTPGLRDLMPSSGPWGHQAYHGAQTYRQAEHQYT